MPLDVAAVRAQFPALASGATYFDNPGGTQVSSRVLERMHGYLLHTNANHGGAFKSSVDSDAVLGAGRSAMADFLGAASPDEIVFGPNMTTLTFSLSRALGRRIGPGDEIVVTRLDHDANIAPWTAVAEDRGATVRWVDFREEDCTLDMSGLAGAIGPRTRIVACGYASNAVGTVNDVKTVARMAHAVGALCFVDAVQFAPHGLVDVRALDCDFLACSAYKFFGPHVGVLYGKYDLLDRLQAYKVRPAPDAPPHKLETGTQNHEGIAGVLGAVEYFEWLARAHAPGHAFGSRREAIAGAMATLAAYERALQAHLIDGLRGIAGLKIWGITDPARGAERLPTVSFTLEGWHPRSLAERLARHRIYAWDGNYYAIAVMERLGLQSRGGMLRVGLAHYNTTGEIEALVELLGRLAAEPP